MRRSLYVTSSPLTLHTIAHSTVHLSNMATLSELCSSKAVGDEPSQSAEDNDSATQQSKNRLHVEKSFSSFAEFQHALDELIKQGGNHPFRVFNSQTGKNYNEKRSGRKYSTDPVDITKFEYPYYRGNNWPINAS